MDPFSVPLLKSVLLLSSGVTVTAAHHYLMGGGLVLSNIFLILTVVLGRAFLALQVFEYAHSPFRIAASIFGTVFFLLTGFHGFHVTIGVLFLCIILLRNL